MKHGTRYCYTQGCGRIECRTAHATYIRELRIARKKLLEADPTLKPHGKASTYINWGCRCTECKQAHGVWLKRRRGGTGI